LAKDGILLDSMGFNAIGVRAAIELCGVDRVVFGTDFGPVPYGIKEHVQIVEDVLPSPAEARTGVLEDQQQNISLGPIRNRAATDTNEATCQ
jgi:predicted TIM-barrel fold metal-dependent hydrolase